MEIKRSLKSAIGDKRIEAIVGSKPYRALVDAVAMNCFSLIYILNDKFIGEKEWDEAWATRLTAALGNTLIGRPYGVFRDKMLVRFDVEEESHFLSGLRNLDKEKIKYGFKKYAVETAVFTLGQSPFYALFLMGGDITPEVLSGIKNLNLQQILHSYQHINLEPIKGAVTSLTLLAPLLGAPQGAVYKSCRKFFGLKKDSK